MQSKLIFAFFASAALSKEVEDGRCPFRPGAIKSEVASSLDLSLIQGKWINSFDEKELQNQFLCMSAKFLQYDDHDKSKVSFQQANSIYEITRQALRETGAEEADQKYFINSGRNMNFNQEDKSVALMEPAFVQILNELKTPDDADQFQEAKWENMYLKYMQVLDTDYTNYMVVYSCQENAEYTDDAGAVDYMADQVFSAFNAQKNRKKDVKDLYNPDNFDGLKGISQSWIHKQKVQVYTRPRTYVDKDELVQFRFQAFENLKLQQLLTDISNKYLPKEFTQHDLDQSYGKMVHDEECDYNPYDNLDYLNIHHEDPKVKEELENHIYDRMDYEDAKLKQMHDEL